ncbi:TetR/AcrR family transcriptional regulator [Vagococcus acidifermentans]|uniref:TetR family transcriptional regulator n=1 Tax=Vagococcus acidifermentans TaxID=564710 RepID=A0A430API7_9ENTE|nr:TetR/AcrR family transcriptional regulator [Vagococcus acidifermentans]RSU10080.1 TetR family transcriptional regulator [Vagococcus acidifermentans]
MARKKTITRDHILNAAYEVVATEGFSRFTARNIASKMKSSTQPIYLEFKNMEELKKALFDKVERYLTDDVFSKVVTGDAVLDLVLNYINFAVEEKILYRSLYVEDYAGGQEINRFSREYFMTLVNAQDNLKDLPDETKDALFSGTWIVATGLASLSSAELIHPTKDEIVAIMQGVIDNLKQAKEFKLTF